MSREFRERYRDVIDAVDELRPGFWTAMADELRSMFERRITTRGAVVREFPTQEEAGIQVVASTSDAATETGVAHWRIVQLDTLQLHTVLLDT